MLNKKIKQTLADCIKKGLYRTRLVTDPSLLCFSSNDYLSLSTDPRVKRAYLHGVTHYPVGSGGSMVVCGYHSVHQQLEAAFTDALGVDDCLLFSSGFLANLSVMNLLTAMDAHVLLDKDVHASVYHGIQQHGTSFARFLHNDMRSLVTQLNKTPKPSVVLTESLFSMSGQLAPLTDIVAHARTQHAPLIVDEAHAFGVLGPEGLGAVKLHSLTMQDVPLRIIPLGKAMAAMGAVVVGDGAWIDALLQVAKPYIYSTGMSPAYAHGILETLTYLREASDRRLKLNALVAYFREAIQQTPWRWRDSHTPIQQLQLGCPNLAMTVAQRLRACGIECIAIRQPTVRQAETGLRVILNYHHEPKHIDWLFECIHQALLP